MNDSLDETTPQPTHGPLPASPHASPIVAVILLSIAIHAGCGESTVASQIDAAPPADAGPADAQPPPAHDGGPGSDLCAGGPLLETFWRDLGVLAAHARTVLVLGDEVLVGTDDGLWRRRLDGTDEWQQSGLQGLSVRALLVMDPRGGGLVTGLAMPNGELLAEPPLAVSHDGGRSWTPAGAELGFDDAGMLRYDAASDLAMDAQGAIYAAMSGSSIARSGDGGQSWAYVLGEPAQVCYPCRLHILPGAPTDLYQGCECPLDMAWIARYDIADASQPMLPLEATVVDTDELGNRRINAFTGVPAAPGVLFAGLEGALLSLEGETWRWLYRATSQDPMYPYVRTIWIDPCDPEHMVFGGVENGANPVLSLFETTRSDLIWEQVPAPPFLTFDEAWVEAGAATGERGEDLILAIWTRDGAGERLHVLVKQHRAP